LHVNKSSLENGKVLCMACRQPIGTIHSSTQMVLNQERGVWKNALRIEEQLFPSIEFNIRNGAIVILSGLLLFTMTDAFDNYLYYTFMIRSNGGTRKKYRNMKGGFKGKMKTREEIQEFVNSILKLQKEKQPFHIMIEGNKMDVHKLLKTNHIITKIVN
jgi:hypothetical protein